MRPDPHLLTGAAALDALPDDESAELAAHLAECETCAAELAGFVETAALLGAVTADTPPARLRESVLAAARATPQLPPATGRVADAGAHRAPEPADRAADGAPAPATGADVVPLRRPWYRRPQALLAAAVAAVVLAAGTAVVVVTSAPDRDVATCVSTAADARVVAPSVGTGGEVVASGQCNQATVTVAGLPPLPGGKVYQLWYLRGQEPVSMGVLATSATGSLQPVTAPLAAGTTAFAVTVEPTGGSAAPTTSPVWVVPL
ncbi:anti-sigma factor [Nakamurella endophytica]|uniref:Regulator of SigK n=1 Tax=Nakamurella endophytica TaxID=1748367 RepID=A0A917T3A9_9ACTN|nr:anti-sigma factor [Nakamurella endophytica]GGM08871.1 hypothetical protein GCM10011594_30950 [Nakamurella endophytica]